MENTKDKTNANEIYDDERAITAYISRKILAWWFKIKKKKRFWELLNPWRPLSTFL